MPLHLLDNLANLTDPASSRNALALGTGNSPQFTSITLTSGGTITGDVALTGNLTASGIVTSPDFSVTTTDGELTSTKDVRSWRMGTQTFNTTGQDTLPSDIFFKEDGLIMYIAGQSNDRVKSYALNPAFDLSTAAFLGQGPNISSTFDGSMDGVWFSDDGSYIFVTGTSSIGRIGRYLLTTPWDITSMAALPNQNIAISTISGMPATTTPRGLAFSGDGKTIFILDDTGNSLYQLSTTNAWDLTGIALVTTFVQSGFTSETSPTSVEFNNDGTRMFITGLFTQKIHEFLLTTPWDVSSGVTYVGRMEASIIDTQPQGLYYNDVVNKCFLIGASTDLVREILVGPNLGLISPVTFSPTLHVGSLNVSNILAGFVSSQNARITSGVSSSSPTTGALIVTGGIGASAAINSNSSVQGVNIINSGAGSYTWLSRSRIFSPADGVVLFTNNLQDNNFGKLQLGGTSVSFPAIKRNGSGIDIVNAADTVGGFTDLRAKTITAIGPVVFPSLTVSDAYMTYSPTSYSGGMIYVTDEIGGACMAYSDGSDWRRVDNNSLISDI